MSTLSPLGYDAREQLTGELLVPLHRVAADVDLHPSVVVFDLRFISTVTSRSPALPFSSRSLPFSSVEWPVSVIFMSRNASSVRL